MDFVIKLLLIDFLVFICFVSSAEYCKYDEEDKYLNCYNFTTLDELTEDLESINAEKGIKKIRFSPKSLLKLDKDSIQLKSIEDFFDDNYEVILENIDGFEFNFNPFDRVKTKALKLELNNVKISFFDKQDIDISANCTLDIFKIDSQLPLFSIFEIIHLNQNINYENPICPVLFKRSSTKKLIVNDAKNKFEFTRLIPSNLNRTLKSNSIIEYELLNLDADKLDETILTEELFTNLEKFKLTESSESTESSFVEISSKFFINYKKLTELYLEIQDFESFYKTSFEWITNLNSGNDNQNKQFKLILKDNNKSPYEYNDDDFCVFSQFPHDKNVFPIIKYSQNYDYENCSCTLLWLNKNYESFSDQSVYSENDTAISVCLKDFKELYQQCNMTSKLDSCRSSETTLATTTKSSTTKKSSTSFPFGFVSVSKNPPKIDNTNTIIFIVVGVLGTILFSILLSIYILRSRKRTAKKHSLAKQYFSNNDEVNIIV